MLGYFPKQATNTPKVRAAIQDRDALASDPAEQFGMTEQTVYKWPQQGGVEDCSHMRKRLQTSFVPKQEAVALRRMLLLSRDDLRAFVRNFLNPNGSSPNHDRCPWRHAFDNLRDLKAKAPEPKRSVFEAYVFGCIHLGVKYLPQIADETSWRYLFVVVDRITRGIFIWLFRTKTTTNAWRFLRDLKRAFRQHSRTVPSGDGKEFTVCLFGLSNRAATGEHASNTPCVALEIKYRLTPRKSSQREPLSAIGKRTMASGIAEHFNGCIDQMMQSHH